MRELTDLSRGACYWALRGRRFKARRIRVDRPENPSARLSEESMARMAASEIAF